jgi:hypothetical protein
MDDYAEDLKIRIESRRRRLSRGPVNEIAEILLYEIIGYEAELARIEAMEKHNEHERGTDLVKT